MDKEKELEPDERMKICNDCDHKKGPICGKCGCVLAFKTKLNGSHCPIDKW